VKESVRKIKIFARTDNTDIFYHEAIIATCVTLDFVNPALSGKPLRFVLLLFAFRHDSPRCKFQRDLSIGVVWRSIARCVRQACNSPTTKNHRAGKNVAARRRVPVKLAKEERRTTGILARFHEHY